MLALSKNCFCMSQSCSSLFGIGVGILVSASVYMTQWLVRGRLPAHIVFCRTWLVSLSGDAAPGTPIGAAGSCRLANSYCDTS